MGKMHKHHFLIALLGCAIFASFLSLAIGLRQSVWFDEAYSILLAEHSWTEIVRLTAADVHPPVYYWLLKAWMAIFGSGELALRSMSALFLGLSVGSAGLLLRRLFGAKTALLALPFVVLAPFLLRYGFEIRMYALVSFIGIASTHILVAAVEEKMQRRRWHLFAIYALLVALGVYTLYFMALLWIAHLAWLAWLSYKDKRREIFVTGVVSYMASFLLFLPWLPIFLSKAGGATLSSVTHKLGLENLYGIVTFLFLYQPAWNMHLATLLAVTFILSAIVYLGVMAYKKSSGSERRYLMLLGMYFAVPVLVLIVVTHISPIYLERYVAHIAIGAYAGIGVLAALGWQRGGKVAKAAVAGLLVVLLIGCTSLATFGNYNFQRVHTPSVKHIATLLTDCQSGAVIFADGPQVAMEFMYYIKDCPIYFFNETLEMGGGFAMLSGSPLRVAEASELPETNKVMQVFYDDPKRAVPSNFMEENRIKIGALGVVIYRVDKS